MMRCMQRALCALQTRCVHAMRALDIRQFCSLAVPVSKLFQLLSAACLKPHRLLSSISSVPVEVPNQIPSHIVYPAHQVVVVILLRSSRCH